MLKGRKGSMTSGKRKYTRLLPSQWAEIAAYWESGDHSLAELSESYGVSTRAIQDHLSKLGCKKGAKAAEMAAAAKEQVFRAELGDQDTIVARARETRERTYSNATRIEDLIMAQLELAQKDPAQAYKAAAAIKMLSLAASAVERLHDTKSRVLGVDKDSLLPDELPVLTIRDLTSAEIEALQKPLEDGEEDIVGCYPLIELEAVEIRDDDDTAIDGGDEIIVEGEQTAEASGTDEEPAPSPSGRLVRGYSP